MRIDYSPESIEDLQRTKFYITENFSREVAITVISRVMDAIDELLNFPNIGISVTQRFGIECDYYYLVTNKNYVFYRFEDGNIKIIRVLNERQDFMYILFGIKTTSKETEDYWNE